MDTGGTGPQNISSDPQYIPTTLTTAILQGAEEVTLQTRCKDEWGYEAMAKAMGWDL